eukprot:gene20414-24496_t
MHAAKDAIHSQAGPLQPEDLRSHKRPAVIWAGIAFFSMCAMLLGMTVWIVWSSHTVRLREAGATTENMARALASQAYMELEIADVMLEDLAEHVRNEGNDDHTGERLESHLVQLSRSFVEIAGVFIFDSQGDWLATSSGTGQEGNNADRDYFIYHKTHKQLGSRISAPVRSKTSGQWVLPVSRRVESADGTFAGVVLVTLGLASFERIYDSLNLGKTGTAFFALDDGTLIYRRPFQGNVIGMDISSGALLRAYREHGPVGTAMMTAKVDEIERLYSYRHLERFPVIVAAGLSQEDIFAEWQRLSMQIVLASLAAGALLLYLFRKLMRQIAIRDRIESSLRLASAELQQANADLATRASQDGLTGLANRRCFDETLAHELNRAQRNGHEIPHAASATGAVTISLGVATLQPGQDQHANSSELIRQADALLPIISMPRIHITLPVAIAALAVWLVLTLGVRWFASAGHLTVEAAVSNGIGMSWALAALFSLALVLASDRRRGAGLYAPQPLKTFWLVWPPLLYALLMLLLAWAGGWPMPRVLLMVACNAALVAISEELMFRGILLQGMLERGALWQAVAAALQGVGYAAIRLRTRSVWPMVLVHGLWDFALVTASLPHPAEDGASILPYAALLAVLPLCLYGVYLLRPSQRAALATSCR